MWRLPVSLAPTPPTGWKGNPVVQRNQRLDESVGVARAACHAVAKSVVLAVLLTTGVGTLSAQTTSPVEDMEWARSILAELVEINTTDSERGDNTVAARALARRLLDAGFPDEDVHVLVPDDAPTKGNLVARYRGQDSSLKPILLLAHIDVVEALPGDWSVDLNPASVECSGTFTTGC